MKKLACLVLPFLIFACSEGTKKTDTPSKVDIKPVVKVASFNADSAYSFVEKQVLFGPRVPNTAAHEACADWMTTKLTSFGWTVTQQRFEMQAYDGKKLALRNIVASFNPENTNRILIAAHWDTRHIADRDSVRNTEPIAGANDGGSGVGVAMELARAINSDINKPKIGIDIILFDGEDYGQPDDSKLPRMDDSWCLGSQYWSKNKHQSNYFPKYGILLDMVGAKNAQFAKEGGSMYYAKNIVEKVWKQAHLNGYGSYFSLKGSDQIIDDHAYVNTIAQIPMIDIIEYSPYSSNGGYFGNYHHTHSDNMEVIDKSTLKAVGQTMLHVIYNE